MATTYFQDGKTTVISEWLNAINDTTYTELPNEIAARIALQARLQALSVGTTAIGNGSIVIFEAPANTAIVQIQGVLQRKSSYTLVGTVLTFSEAPPINSTIEFSG